MAGPRSALEDERRELERDREFLRAVADASPNLLVVVDDTGGITLVFLARRQLAGVHPGTVMRAEGMVGAHQRRLAMLNPIYELEHVPID